jgi:hypothetical protein
MDVCGGGLHAFLNFHFFEEVVPQELLREP